ncbi:MAG: DUF5724 domain-containing protein [Christensenellaceae bacterium]|jgi:hypothetical protein|nr:DUF5724 domain-containing protein [Christensenellaceae bacterium]
MEKDPAFGRYVLEMFNRLKDSSDPSDHETILLLLIDVANDTSVFYEIFKCLESASISFVKFIIPKILEHKFYEIPCVVDGVSWYFRLYYHPKDGYVFFSMLNDILSNDYKKYLDAREPHIVYTLLEVLKLVDEEVHQEYFKNALISSDKNKRFITFVYLSRGNLDNKLEICNEHFIQSNIEMCPVLIYCIPSFDRSRYCTTFEECKLFSEKKTAVELLYKLYDFITKNHKKTITFKIQGEYSYSHSIRRKDIIEKIFYLLSAINDDKLIYEFEEKYYSSLDYENKVSYVLHFSEYLQNLDFRRELLNYFAPYFSDNITRVKIASFFLNKPLTFDEGVIVSDFLKYENVNTRKQIIDYYLRMNVYDLIRLKKYLSQSKEQYKIDALTSLEYFEKVQTSNDATKKRYLAPVKFKNVCLPEMSKSKQKACLDKFSKFVILNFTALCNLQYSYDPDCGVPHNLHLRSLHDEYCRLIRGFDLKPNELVSLVYSLMKRLDDRVMIVDEIHNGTSRDESIFMSTCFIQAIKAYLIDNNSPTIQKAFVNCYLAILNEIDFPNNLRSDDICDNLELRDELHQCRRDLSFAKSFSDNIRVDLLDDETLTVLSQILDYINYYPNADIMRCLIEIFSHFHDKGIIEKSVLFDFLKSGNVSLANILSAPQDADEPTPQEYACYLYNGTHSKEYIDLVECVIVSMLEREIQRGPLPTNCSLIISTSDKLFGVEFYLKALSSFQKKSFPQHSDMISTIGKKTITFSNIVKSTIPYKTDTYEIFSNLVSKLNLKAEDLIKGALFNNSWTILVWTSKLLKKDYLTCAIMFFKTLLRDANSTNYLDDKIAIYSPINISDFNDGAVDVDWFSRVKKETDKETFNLIYANARHVCRANIYSRAKCFLDALSGELTKEECLSKLNEKGGNAYILYYSVIPIVDEDDIDTRYFVINEKLHALQESSCSSSKLRVFLIALDNLARNCGYGVDHFIWYLASKSADRIAPYFTGKIIGDYEVMMSAGKHFPTVTFILTTNRKKQTDTCPINLRDDPYVDRLNAINCELFDQPKKAIKSLEISMIKRRVLKISEIKSMSKNPLMLELLRPLFYISRDSVFTFQELLESSVTDCIIAHPVDLLSLNVFQDKKNYLLSNKIEQPFMQVFRKIFKMEGSETNTFHVNRYHGSLILRELAISKATEYGWLSVDIGFQKVFITENVIALISTTWNCGYTIFDETKTGTISSIYFLDSNSFEIIPLKSINPIIFSEVIGEVEEIVSKSCPE